jgi:Ca2+-binding RTX toxin-like protein
MPPKVRPIALFALVALLLPTTAPLRAQEVLPLPLPHVAIGVLDAERSVEWMLQNDVENDECSIDGQRVFDVDDALVGPFSDPFDGGMAISVDGTPFVAQDDGVNVLDETVIAESTREDLSISVQHRSLSGLPILRTVVALTNTSTSHRPAVVTFDSALGSDESTVILGTSGGDAVLDDEDRWIATSDDPAMPSDPPVLLVLGGPTDGRIPLAVRHQPLEPADRLGEACVTVDFDVAIEPGGTRYLMFFSALASSNEESLAQASLFDTELDFDGPYLAGVPFESLDDVVNWSSARCPVGGPGRRHVVGTDGPDALVGTNGDDVICGFGGSDTIEGGGGDDLIYAGPGFDTVDARDGRDRVLGGDGADILLGGNGPDLLEGGGGEDLMFAGEGNDQVRGNGGSDSLFGGLGADVLRGEAGKDACHLGPGGRQMKGCDRR